MEYNNNNDGMLREEQNSSTGWIWWIIGILIVLGLLWFFFGRSSDDVNIIDDVDNTGQEEVERDPNMEYDENGLPLAGPLAPINNTQVEIAESFPVQVAVLVSGNLPDGCTYLNSPAHVRDGNTFYVNLTTRTEGETCTQALVPYERRIPLDTTGLPAGTYLVDINGQQVSFEIEQTNQVDFQAGSDK